MDLCDLQARQGDTMRPVLKRKRSKGQEGFSFRRKTRCIDYHGVM